jgi:dimethylargininase
MIHACKLCVNETEETKMFKNVIVRRPCKALTDGITSAPELGKPDYELALKQHDAYIDALKRCGVEVTVLAANELYPDSCFVEDAAVITKHCAIITNPGADSRRGEASEILPTVKTFFADEKIEYIKSPGTLEGGDVMMVGDHFYVGRSARTNAEGIRQFIEILGKYGLTGSEVLLEEVLHLKTGVNYIEKNNMLVSGEFIDKPDFKKFNKVIVPKEEAYGANCIWVNDFVIVADGYPSVLAAVQKLGYGTIVTDTSEYRKLDGGLSCLSLRF